MFSFDNSGNGSVLLSGGRWGHDDGRVSGLGNSNGLDQ
jgi:hypothetical protein